MLRGVLGPSVMGVIWSSGGDGMGKRVGEKGWALGALRRESDGAVTVGVDFF
jgi:hypothetical protein